MLHVPFFIKAEVHVKYKKNAVVWYYRLGEVNLLFNVTIYDISVIYVTAHRCAGGTEEEVEPTVGLPTP